jgi:GTPase SAR1 family protein
VFSNPPGGPPDRYRPWARGQVRIADAWPERPGQRVSVALAPAADRLALSVGQSLCVTEFTGTAPLRPGLQLTCALTPGLAWSAAGDKLAFRDETGHGRLLDLSGPIPGPSAQARLTPLGPASVMAFSPDGALLAKAAPALPGRMTLTVLRPGRGVVWEKVLPRTRKPGYLERVSLAWSPDGSRLACTTGMSAVWVLDAATGEEAGQFGGHRQTVTGVGWIDAERVLSASADATLQVWQPGAAGPVTVIETIAVAGLAFTRDPETALIWSADGGLLAWSLGAAPPVQLWYRDPPSRSVAAHFTRLSVSAVDGLLALVDAGSTDLLLVSDWDRVAAAPAATRTYANAKVLLLGDSGVGKSGLAMVLAGEEFQATESTHGRKIWQLPANEQADSADDHREVLLWDLAGQPGYRIVHQLHLDGASAALVLFDAKSETAPLAGVQHWARAVRHAHPVSAGGLPTFLVAARADRGGIAVSDQRIKQIVASFELDGYFQTSAKEGTDMDVLRTRLLAAIDWERIPEVTSTDLFAAVKQFVVAERTSGGLLTPLDELRRRFQATMPDSLDWLADEEQLSGLPELSGDDPKQASAARLPSLFEGCVARLESAGLVKRLKFGDYVLLQPELLDAYAGAMVNAARDEPDGLGSILESRVVALGFAVPSTGRVRGAQQERLLVIATLEELLQHELVLSEPTEEGTQLVFPSAYRRDLPPSQIPKGDGVVFRFEGPIINVYATLIVRLTRSDRFTRKATWQSAARFAAEAGECTVFLKYDTEGEAELQIGYDGMPGLLRKQFERFVHLHLNRRAMPGSVTRERRYSCPHDGTAFTSEQVFQVLRLGRQSIRCPVCEDRIPLRDDYELADGGDQSTEAMDASADAGREIATASAVLRGKEEVEEFDVFVCYNREDRVAARRLAQQLRERGLRPWMDESQLRPGEAWQPAIENFIAKIPAAAVLVGSRLGPVQNQEVLAFLRQLAMRRCPVIPVLLPGAQPKDVPVFLEALTWVDLGVTEPDPLDQLEWGITRGQRDG